MIRDFESHADRAQCVELQELTWGRGFTEKIPAAMLLVAQKTGGVTAGAVWQHPVRITSPIQGGKDGKLRLASNRWVNPGSTVRITDGANTELAVIAHEERTGEVFLDRVLVNDYAA